MIRLIIFLHIWLSFLVCQSWAGDHLKISGNTNFGASYSKQRNLYDNNTGLVNDSQIYLRAQNIINSDYKFGVIVKGEYVVRSDRANLDPTLDKAFLFAKAREIGNFEIGNVEAVNQKLKVGGFSVARGAGGVNGKYLENISLANQGGFILLAQSPIGHGGGTKSALSSSGNFNDYSHLSIKDNSFDGLEDASKLSYISNRMDGFKVGISYTPNVQDQGVTNSGYYNYENNLAIRDIFSFGVNYFKYFDNLSVELSASSEVGNVDNNLYSGQARQDLFAYDTGLVLSYFGFDLGFSYGSWGKSLRTESDYDLCKNCSDPYYFTSGISYEIGPLSASVTALNSNYYDNKFRSLSFDFDYKVTKHLMTYIEVTKFESTSNNYGVSSINSIFNNHGYVAMVGTLITF